MPRKLIFVHPSSARVFPQGTDSQFYSFLVPSFNPIWVPCAERSRRILIGWKVEVAWLEDGLEDDIILL